MPPDMAIDMRHTKLTPEEAALLAGELKKPSWQSKNEGIHERVSFEDSIWGFDLAGGSYYKTPLRVVAVKPDSRAEKAGIRPGDKLKRINDIDTSTLTIQEAHEIIIEAGVHLRIAVTAPEDEEDAYFCYEDPVDNGYDSDEERRLQEELERKRQVHAKVSSYWSLQWPWVSKRRVIYRESNCFLVPSKFEDKHRDKFPTQPILKTQDDIVLQSAKNEKDNELQSKQTEITKPVINGEPINGNHKNEDTAKSNNSATNSSINGAKENGINGNLGGIPELEEESVHDEVSSSDKDNSVVEAKPQEDNYHTEDISSQNDDTAIELDTKNEMVSNLEQDNQDDDPDTQNEESVAESHSEEVMNSQDDEILDEVLDENDESVSKGEEDNILNSILSNNSEQGVENSESIDER